MFWTGIWYNDSNRLAALLPTVTIPVAVIGAERLIRWTATKCARFAAGRISVAARFNATANAAAAAALVLVVAFLVQGGSLGLAQDKLAARYVLGNGSLLISADEYELLKRLPRHVPEGETVLGSSWTGASLVYALSDRPTVTPHIFGQRSADEHLVLRHWEDAAHNDAICPAVKRLGVYWALDFGSLEVHRGSHPLMGLTRPETARGVELVDQEGDAALYKLSMCQ